MRILVTGGAGYIGSQTAKLLAGSGITPVVLDNLSTGHAWAVRWGPFVKGDLGDAALIRNVLKEHQVEAVIHFAANAYVGESVRNPRKYFRNNVVNTLNLLDAMQDVGVTRMVFSSTCTVYGDPQTVPIPEDHPLSAMSPYGESKLFVEKMLHWYGQAYGLQWAALRYFNASGADPEGDIGEVHEPETHLIPLTVQAALGQVSHLDIYGTDYPTADGTAVRDYTHVVDLAQAHLLALNHLQRGGESMAANLGTGMGHSVREVIVAVEEATDRRVPLREMPRRSGDAPALVANPDRAASVLGWQPRYPDLQSIVATAVRWHVLRADMSTG